ncbi:MAG: 23S rRNA (guanosine(2251)-2'-O)-methyltransferase RlmB [Planctomycetaceae bacterium]
MSRSSSHRRSRRRQLQSSHQKRWLTGRYAVLEVLRAGRWPVEELLVADDLSAAENQEVERLAQQTDVNVQRVSRDRLTQLCDSTHHQGFVAGMAAYPYLSVDELLKGSLSNTLLPESDRPPLLVVCDRIQDTFNFGAILRCCDAMHVCGVVIGESQQAGVTPQVARSSSGAVNHVPVALSDNLTDAVTKIREVGFVTAAASEKSERPAWDFDLRNPVTLIIGSEAEGISEPILDLCDQHLRIPMMGQISSLNAAVAAGILLYEIRRQQR